MLDKNISGLITQFQTVIQFTETLIISKTIENSR